MTAAVVETDLDLEALFDQVAAEREAQDGGATAAASAREACAPEGAAPAAVRADAAAGEADDEDPNASLYRRIGQVTRMLHEALRELGYDRKLQSAASTMPDARKRLEYVASLTGRSANVVLEGVEKSQALQEAIEHSAAALTLRWQALYDGALSPEDFKALAEETRAYLGDAQVKAVATRAHLHEIMMAQDFHDLTGQVIKKIVDIAHTVEGSLVELLIETKQGDVPAAALLSGPVIGNEPASEVVSSQAQVDQLLNSLGF